MNMINDFERELECDYKGETYSVRDNGAVMRHSHVGKKPRPTDNMWTFGRYNLKTGYAEIAGERVHRIVATAFHGVPPSPQHVVDHIDTNRRNNRPENLRWVTKLENILLNPITAKRIELLCGSIEEFLRDPSILQRSYIDHDFEWMRAVSKEEAAISLARLQSWAKSDKHSSGGSLGEWIYQRGLYQSKIETERLKAHTDSKSSATITSETIKAQQSLPKQKAPQALKSNPFDFPRANETDTNNTIIMYRTNSEMFELLKSQFDLDTKIKLPNVILPTAGKGIVIKEAWIENFQECEYCYEGRARTPKYIILRCQNNPIALLIRKGSTTINQEEINQLINKGYNIVEIDLSWAKDGVTELEMKHILQADITKKMWIHHELVNGAKEKLLTVCEPMNDSGHGLIHSYVACPLTSDSVQDIECWYCNYRVEKEIIVDGEKGICDYCFGKSGVQTYQDLLSVINVEKEDEQIVSITYNKNGEIFTKKFDKEVQLPGKTIFQLWDERTNNEIIVHNIYSGWYVLIEEDPKMSFNTNGNVYGKLGRDVEELRSCPIRSIFSIDSCCWEIIK